MTHRAALSGGNEEIGMHWPQPLTFGITSGVFALVVNLAYSKWLAPRLPARASITGAGLANLVGILFPCGVGWAQGRLPAYTIPFAIVGMAIGVAFSRRCGAPESR